MNFGTIKSQTQLKVMDLKWQQKKSELSLGKKTQPKTGDELMLEQLKESAEQNRKSNAVADIYNKLKTGGKLTPEEIEYLKANDPKSLAEYESAQAEQKAYEEKLKHCKTKDEVERLKTNTMSNYVSQAKSISNDPYIPKGEKIAMLWKLNNRVSLLNEAHTKFVSSVAYDKLPTEAEINEEQAKEQKAEFDEQMAKQIEASEELADETEKNEAELTDQKPTVSSGVTEGQESIASDGNEHESSNQNASEVRQDSISFDSVIKEIETYIRKNGQAHSSVNFTV